MSSWTIKKQIILGLSILILINIVAGIFTSVGITKLKGFAEHIAANQLRGVYLLGQIRAAEDEAHGLMLQHLLADTAQETDLDNARLNELEARIDRQFADYQQSAEVTDREKAALDRLSADRDALVAAWSPVHELSLQLKNKDAFDLFKTQAEPAFAKLRADLQQEIDYNKQVADLTTAESVAVTNNTAYFENISIAVMLTACLAIAFVIVRSLNRVLTDVADTLGEGSHRIVDAASQLASASQKLARNANNQAVSLQETSSAIEQIGSMTKRNSENAQKAHILSGETRLGAELCAQRTEEMQGAMKSIQKASTEMAVAIHGITTSSNSISKIISTIDEIAFQTNILALNAAVEAARAGEAGMGFAVVAEEVRSLARRSADAAKETASMIEAAVTQSQRGVEVNSKVTASIAEVAQKANGVRDSLGHIVGKAREVDSVISQITEASKEQNSGLEQINTAINTMNQVTQANAAGSEETAAASEELTAQSIELRAGVDVLVKLVNGQSYAETHARSTARHARGKNISPTPPVPAKSLPPRTHRPAPAVNGKTNGHHNGNGHTATNGDLHDDSFFDM
jgi:methyl-accepting chemotaxis protein